MEAPWFTLIAARTGATVKKGTLWVVGPVAAALVFGIGSFVTRPFGAQITECGFDAHGAYAKFRANNLTGFFAHEQPMIVHFYVKGDHSAETRGYDLEFVDVMVPALGRGTAVAHGRFPPLRSKVEGRTVYRVPWFNGKERVGTKRSAMKHTVGRTSIETVPDDPNVLRCTVERDLDGYDD